MKIDKTLFITKMRRFFEIGCYPYVEFSYLDKSYRIEADLNRFCLMELIKDPREMISGEIHYRFVSYDFREIGKWDSLDEVFRTKIDGQKALQDIWVDIEFVDDDEWKYTYAYHDSVKIIESGVYGLVIDVITQDEDVLYKIDTNMDFSKNEENIFMCKEEELEYDVRPSYIEACRRAYQNYQDRISGA